APQPELQLAGAEVFASLEEALVRAEQWAREQGVGELMLIGGAQLYGQALEKGLVNRMYLTRVELAPEGDAWFPAFDEGQWRLTSSEAQAEEGKPAYHFEVWDKG
ncbi:dihydrofolate reductase, partial [Pseudomonas monteilii]|uniref:dihydrofolate reductase n=1 Tax=Pseudomonas monteilii TaxID=76759 RepID=UPI00211E09A7